MRVLPLLCAAVLLAHGAAAALTDAECGAALENLFTPAAPGQSKTLLCLTSTPALCQRVCQEGLRQIANNDPACPSKLGDPAVFAPTTVDG